MWGGSFTLRSLHNKHQLLSTMMYRNVKVEFLQVTVIILCMPQSLTYYSVHRNVQTHFLLQWYVSSLYIKANAWHFYLQNIFHYLLTQFVYVEKLQVTHRQHTQTTLRESKSILFLTVCTNKKVSCVDVGLRSSSTVWYMIIVNIQG